MSVITLTTGELENLLKQPGSINKPNRIAIFRKGVETELAEGRLGLTVPEMEHRIQELCDDLEYLREKYSQQ
jgi:hypothetical protein